MRRETPLVSVIVTAYRQESFIRETLMSLVEQDYERLEIVVRDDASPDGTADVIADVAQRHPERIKMLSGDVNLGITRNANEIMRACTGTYIAMLGGDDVALPGKISRQVEWLEEDPRRILCHHDVEVFDSATDQRLFLYSERHALRGGSVVELMQYPAFCTAVAVMLRSSCIPPGLHDERIHHASDWLLWMETLLAFGPDNPGAGFVPGVLSRYRRHGQNVTSHADAYGLDEAVLALDILESRAPSLASLIRVAKAERTATYGFRRALRGDLRSGAELAVRSARMSPRGLMRSLVNAIAYFGVAGRWKHPPRA